MITLIVTIPQRAPFGSRRPPVVRFAGAGDLTGASLVKTMAQASEAVAWGTLGSFFVALLMIRNSC